MNRRLFLRNAGLLAAGLVAVDQLQVLERLEPRRLFPAWGNTNTPPKLWGDGVHDDTAALQWRLDHGDGHIVQGRYSIMGQLHVREGSVIHGNSFEANHRGGITTVGVRSFAVTNNIIRHGNPGLTADGWTL